MSSAFNSPAARLNCTCLCISLEAVNRYRSVGNELCIEGLIINIVESISGDTGRHERLLSRFFQFPFFVFSLIHRDKQIATESVW